MDKLKKIVTKIRLAQSDAVQGASKRRPKHTYWYDEEASKRSNEEMRRLCKSYKNSGFSVIEAMIAMTIILMTLSASIFVSFGNQNFIIGEKTNTEAIDKAQELLEQAQASARKDFRMVNPIDVATDGIYKKWLEVKQSSVATDYFSKLATSHISWTDDSKMMRNLELSSLVTDFENAVGGDTCNSFLTGDWKNPQNTNVDFASLVGDVSGTYPITDIDAYQGKLYVTVEGSSSDSGQKDPSSATDNNGIGTIAWNNPEEIKNRDGVNTTATLSGTSITHYLKANNFGFNIPKGATILGIKVDIFRNASDKTSTNAVIDSQVRLIKADGNLGSSNEATSVKWSATPQSVQYGGESKLWDETDWNSENINSPNFGVAFAVTGNSVSADRIAYVDSIKVTITYIKEFYILDISNPTNPTLITGLGSNADIDTGFNAVATDGHYAYVATNSGVRQFQIIDISSMMPTVVSSLEIPDENAVGQSIFYHNGYVYLGLKITTGGNEFNIIDVHNPLNPQLVGKFPIGRTVNKIYVRGNYAFISKTVSNTSPEMLTVLDISNPTNPSKISGFNNFSGFGGNGKSLFMTGDILYFGRTTTSSLFTDTLPEFYALDESNLNATPPILGSLPLPDSGDSVNSILVRDYLAFLLTHKQLQIRQINKNTPWTFSQYTTPISLPNSGAGVALDCEGNYLYSASVPTSGAFENKGSISITTTI